MGGEFVPYGPKISTKLLVEPIKFEGIMNCAHSVPPNDFLGRVYCGMIARYKFEVKNQPGTFVYLCKEHSLKYIRQ